MQPLRGSVKDIPAAVFALRNHGQQACWTDYTYSAASQQSRNSRNHCTHFLWCRWEVPAHPNKHTNSGITSPFIKTDTFMSLSRAPKPWKVQVRKTVLSQNHTAIACWNWLPQRANNRELVGFGIRRISIWYKGRKKALMQVLLGIQRSRRDCKHAKILANFERNIISKQIIHGTQLPFSFIFWSAEVLRSIILSS